MTHYQKLATMIFRIIGVTFLVFGAVASVISIIFLLGWKGGFLVALFYGLPPIVFGIVFFSFSRKLAEFVCFDFDKFNEQ